MDVPVNGTLKMARLAIGLFLLASVVVVAIWDLVLTIRHGEHYTVSAMLREWAKTWPLLPLGVGLVIGHLFWR